VVAEREIICLAEERWYKRRKVLVFGEERTVREVFE